MFSQCHNCFQRYTIAQQLVQESIELDSSLHLVFLSLVLFSIPGLFWVGKFWQAFFFGWLDLSRDFWGYSKLMFLFFVLYHLMFSGNFYGL